VIIDFKVKHNPKPWVIYVRHTKRPESHRYMEAWQKKVGEAAATAYTGDDILINEPVRIDTHFYLEPAKDAPKRTYKTWRDRRIVEKGRGNPDLDNLRKSTIDGLQEVLIDNDCMVIAGAMSKQYIRDPNDVPYAHIIVYTGDDIYDDGATTPPTYSHKIQV
jgi:Holliday junction resolvase RusA-like endonuclease